MVGSGTPFETVIEKGFEAFRLIAIKKEGDHFGEIALESRIPRTATVVAKSPSSCAILTFELFHRCLGAFNDRI